MRALIAVLVLLAACGAGAPAVDHWVEESWEPVAALVPPPEEATPALCQVALERLREIGPGVRPAPTPELGEIAVSYVRRAETAVFECAADNAEFDYAAAHAALAVMESEIEAGLAALG